MRTGIFWTFLFISLPAAAAILPWPVPVVRCETFLSDPRAFRVAAAVLVPALERTPIAKAGVIEAGTTKRALAAFGLEHWKSPRQPVLRTLGLTGIQLIDDWPERVLVEFPLNPSRLYSWRVEPTGDPDFGFVLDDTALFGRRFFGVREIGNGNFEFIVGVDVPCELIRRFTENRSTRLQIGESFLCRVPVFSATAAVRTGSPSW